MVFQGNLFGLFTYVFLVFNIPTKFVENNWFSSHTAKYYMLCWDIQIHCLLLQSARVKFPGLPAAQTPKLLLCYRKRKNTVIDKMYELIYSSFIVSSLYGNNDSSFK